MASLPTSPFPTTLCHRTVNFLTSWDWKGIRDPGCQQQSLLRVLFPSTLLGIARFRLRDFLLPHRNCFSWSLWFCTLFQKAPALYSSIFRRVVHPESTDSAFSQESGPCFSCWMKRRAILCALFLASFRQHRNKATVWSLEANLGACFQCLLSIFLQSNLPDSENIFKQPWFPECPFLTAGAARRGAKLFLLWFPPKICSQWKELQLLQGEVMLPMSLLCDLQCEVLLSCPNHEDRIRP